MKCRYVFVAQKGRQSQQPRGRFPIIRKGDKGRFLNNRATFSGSARRFGKSTANNTLSYQELSLGRPIRSLAGVARSGTNPLPTRIFRYYVRECFISSVVPHFPPGGRSSAVSAGKSPSTSGIRVLYSRTAPHRPTNAALGYSSLFLKDRLGEFVFRAQRERERGRDTEQHHHHLVNAFVLMCLVPLAATPLP